MRTILLTNVEFNMNNKRIGKEVFFCAEVHMLLAKDKFGSRKVHDSTTAALIKRLTFDIFCLFRTPGILISNNAKSFYDRLVRNIAIVYPL